MARAIQASSGNLAIILQGSHYFCLSHSPFSPFLSFYHHGEESHVGKEESEGPTVLVEGGSNCCLELARGQEFICLGICFKDYKPFIP